MPSFDIGLLGWAYLVFTVYLFIHGVCTLNLMTVKTPLAQRIGYTMFTVGVFSAALALFSDPHEPTFAEISVFFGLSIYHAYRASRLWRANVKRMKRRSTTS